MPAALFAEKQHPAASVFYSSLMRLAGDDDAVGRPLGFAKHQHFMLELNKV